MALLTPLPDADGVRIGKLFGLDVRSVFAIEAGSVNSNFRFDLADGTAVFARIYEEQDRAGALAELEILHRIAAAGVPTTIPQTRTDGERLAEHAGKPVSIYPWVEGEVLCQKGVSTKAAATLGAALAQVHLAGASLPSIPPSRFRPEALEARLQSIAETGRFDDAVRFIRDKLAEYGPSPAELPRGLLHGDLFRDNVLWQGENIAALIDFEAASDGVFVFDLMVCVMAWCYADDFDVDLVTALLGGYHAARPLNGAEWSALAGEGARAALRFATTRITDFSLRVAPGQMPGRDYRRFFGRLKSLEAGVLDPVMAQLRG